MRAVRLRRIWEALIRMEHGFRNVSFSCPLLESVQHKQNVIPFRQLLFVLELKVADGKFTEIEMIADPERLQKLDLAILNR
jgi:hypothetical protein